MIITIEDFKTGLYWFMITVGIGLLFVYFATLLAPKQDTIQPHLVRAIRQVSFDGNTWVTIDTITLKP